MVFAILFIRYTLYSIWVYTTGTDKAGIMSGQQRNGKQLY